MTAAKFLRKWAAPGETTHSASIKKLFNGGRGQVLSKVTPAAGDAGVNVRNVTGTQQNAALPRFASPQVVNGDGLATKPTTASIIGAKVSPVLGKGVVTMAGADRSRETAEPFSSGANDTAFHAMADLPQGNHPSAIPRLEQHGISVGIKDGILVIQRKYVVAATGLLQTLAGGR